MAFADHRGDSDPADFGDADAAPFAGIDAPADDPFEPPAPAGEADWF